MPLKTFDDRNIELTSNISHVFHTDSGSGNVSKTHYFDITGNGFVVVTASVRCTGSTNDYGTSSARIFLNGERIAQGYNRLTVANTEEQGISISAGLQVADGDVVEVGISQTKNGAKTFLYYCLCVGCTATYR